VKGHGKNKLKYL